VTSVRSTFHGLSTANSGLFMAQRQLDVTGHNIANANVKGYSRQRYATAAVYPKYYRPQFVSSERGIPGQGVESLSLDQIRDVFLDRQFREQQTKTSYWDTRSSAMFYVEDIFNSIDQNSLDGILHAFYNSIQELSKNPQDPAIRTNMISEASRLCDAFGMYYNQLTTLMGHQDTNMVEEAKRTNGILSKIAALNDNILRFELGGSIANDLRDQRNLLLDELSSLMDITYTEIPFDPPAYNIYGIELTQFQVYAGKNTVVDEDSLLLVSHKEVRNWLTDAEGAVYGYQETQGDSSFNDVADDADPPLLFHRIFLGAWDGDLDSPANVGVELSKAAMVAEFGEVYEGGILQSYMDLRDGDAVENIGIPYFIKQLNRLVETFVTEFNAIHSAGFTMPFSNDLGSSDSVSGVDFFDVNGLTARTMALSEDILLSAFNIAASSERVVMDSDEHQQTGNNENVLALIQGIIERTDFEDLGGSVDAFYKTFLGTLATETSQANGMTSSHNVLLTSIQHQRESVSSVDEDEEMTNIIRFQHAYNAAARCITSIDEMLDKLINGTGRVGL